jgi:hypothetical protein
VKSRFSSMCPILSPGVSEEETGRGATALIWIESGPRTAGNALHVSVAPIKNGELRAVQGCRAIAAAAPCAERYTHPSEAIRNRARSAGLQPRAPARTEAGSTLTRGSLFLKTT